MTKGPCTDDLQVVKGRDPVVILGVVFDALLSTLLMGASAAGLMTALIGSSFTPSPSYEVQRAAYQTPSLPCPGNHWTICWSFFSSVVALLERIHVPSPL